MAKKFYITTPIYYVNDVPHIGHTCTTLVADVIARYHKLLGEDVFFLTGTDEHGAKIAEAAKKTKLTPKKFCDQVSKNFQEVWPKLNIQYDYFIRTTNPQHEKIVQKFIEKIYKNGDIYKAKYEGFYCVACEKFVTEIDLVNGKCPFHPKQKLQKQVEMNYFFRLSKYVPRLIKAIESNEYLILPKAKRNEILVKLKDGVNDLSISRASVAWGIPIPWDKQQTIYVWFDALLNYYTALKINKKEKFWPPDLHLIGKEILWFHTVVWQAMLLSAGVSLPKTIFAHSFYTIDGQKMSKSLGNVISPQQLLEKFGVDGTRYLIASGFPYENDTDVGWKKFEAKYNADLANGLGNLVARVAKLCEKANFTPPYSEDKYRPTKFKKFHKLMREYKINEAVEFVWEKISQADKYINDTQPWLLEGEKLNKILNFLVKEIREIALLLAPFLPQTSEKIRNQFAGPKIKSQKPLFPRIN